MRWRETIELEAAPETGRGGFVKRLNEGFFVSGPGF